MIALAVLALASPEAAGTAPEGAAASLYRSACLACHGARGEGLPPDDPRLATFDPPPTDLTDPEFSSSEPRRDWFLAIKHGGAALGLSAQMPAFGEVLDDAQIDALVAHVKSFAATERYPPGDANLLRPHLTKKAFPEDELLLLGRFRRREGEPSRGAGTVYFGKRFGARSQAEVKVVEAFEGGGASLEEVELGVKHALAFGRRRPWLLSAGLEASIPVRLDDETPRAHAYLAYARPLGERFDWQASLEGAVAVPAGAAAPAPAEIAAATALFFRPTPWKRGVFPGLEVKAAGPVERPGDASVTLAPQLFTRLSRRGHVGLSLAAELPIVNRAFDHQAHAFLVWEFAEGAPWDGW